MKFTTEQERLDLIQGFKEKAASLTQSMQKEIPDGTSIIFETVTEWDEEKTKIPNHEIDGEFIEEHGGDIYVCFIRQPHIMTAVTLMDKLAKKDSFSAGFAAWDAMVLPFPISSKEITQYRIQLGLVQRISQALDGAMPDLKKN